MAKDDSTTANGGIISIIVLIVLGIWIYNTWIKSDWQAFYDDGMSSHSMGRFGDKESCLKHIYEKGYGECGKNCRPPESPSGLYVCKETAD